MEFVEKCVTASPGRKCPLDTRGKKSYTDVKLIERVSVY